MLTEVHRQAQDNPIVRLSMDIRAGKPLTEGHYGETSGARGDLDPSASSERPGARRPQCERGPTMPACASAAVLLIRYRSGRQARLLRNNRSKDCSTAGFGCEGEAKDGGRSCDAAQADEASATSTWAKS